MVEISKSDIAKFMQYLKESDVQFSEVNATQINSIFEQCDTVNENGEQCPDGKLSGDEVPKFQKMIMEKMIDISSHLQKFVDNLAKPSVEKIRKTEQIQKPEAKPVECDKTPEEQELYKKNLNIAKNILIKNAETLELSREEINYINNIDLESITYGAARYDRESDKVIFNINDSNKTSVGYFVKIIMHEVTHGILKDTNYSQEQELVCESRGITVAKKLYENINNQAIKEYFDFPICKDKNGNVISLSNVDENNNMDTYLNEWIKNYSHLPKE